MATAKTAPAAAAKKAPAASKPTGIVAYCVKTKQKNVPMLKAVINVSSGKYVAVGFDADGNKMAAIMNEATAKGHIADKHAVKGTGW